ncbi:MAG: hypothetical protein ACYC25_09505, partial [Paludibacter sp.]
MQKELNTVIFNNNDLFLRQFMLKTTRIIYIKPSNSSFIRGDQEILEKQFEVQSFLMYQNKNKVIFGWRLFLLFFYLLSNVFRRNVIFVAWFA